VITAVEDAAQRAIEQAEVIRLSLAGQQRFAQALLTPPKPVPALRRAMARHDKLAPMTGDRPIGSGNARP